MNGCGRGPSNAGGDCIFPHCGCGQPTKYSAETYVGNWYEDTVRNTLKREDFLRKRECEDLAIQRSQIMVDTLLKPVSLTAKADGLLHYGDSIQIVAPGSDCASAIQASPFNKLCKLSHIALSASVGPKEIDLKPWLDTDSVFTASPHLFPCVRNSYVIEHPDNCTAKGAVHYGDCFRIRAMPTQQYPLYLHAAPAIKFHSCSAHAAKPLVRFSDTKNPNTLWMAYPLEPGLILRMPGGISVPLKMRLTIKHALSGKNLLLEESYPTLTYFGCEYEVSVETKRDTVRRIGWQNHWAFDTERGWPSVPRDFMTKAKFAAEINADMVNKSASDEARKEEEIKREMEGPTQDELTCEELEEQQKGEIAKRMEWDAMIRKAVEDQCSPRQKKEASRYLEIPLPEPPVCLSEIPELVVPYAQRKAECDQLEAERMEKQRQEDYERQRYLETGIPGHIIAHDPRTSPQPHSHQYTLGDNQRFYPNQKWGCKDTNCCYPRSPQPPCLPCNQERDCAECRTTEPQ